MKRGRPHGDVKKQKRKQIEPFCEPSFLPVRRQRRQGEKRKGGMPPNSQSEQCKEHHLFTSFLKKKKGEVELCVCMKDDVSCYTEGRSLFLKSSPFFP